MVFAKRTNENIIPMYRQQLIGIGNASNKRGATHIDTHTNQCYTMPNTAIDRPTDRPTEEQESHEQENHRKEHFIAILTNT